MSWMSWCISDEAATELIELALDGKMTVETFTELSVHMTESWEEQATEIITRNRLSSNVRTKDATAYLTGSSNLKKRHLTLIQTLEQ